MRTTPRSLTTLTTALVGIALATSACSGGDPEAEPTPIMPPTTATTTTATPEPEPWEVRSRAGVNAFLERYVDISHAALITGDTTALRKLAKDCDGCNDVVKQIEDVYEAGGHITSKPDKYLSSSIDEDGLKGGADCVLIFQSSPTTWVRAQGAEPETYPGGKIEQLVNLEWSGSEWVITGLFPLPS